MKINSPSQRPFLMFPQFRATSLLDFFPLSSLCSLSPRGMGEFPLLGKLCDNGELPYPLWALVRKQIGANLNGRTWMNLEATEENLSLKDTHLGYIYKQSLVLKR